MHFGTFVHAAESRQLAFFCFLGLIQALKKCSTSLVSPNSIKIVPNGMFFGAATGSGMLLCCAAVAALQVNQHFFRGIHPTPLKTEIFTLSTKSQTFYTINFFF